MSSSGFWELAVGVSADLSEGLTNLVWELGALGVVEEEQPGQGARLRAFFPGTIFASALEAQVRAYLDGLRELGFEPPTDVSVVALADENWADAWRAHFRSEEHTSELQSQSNLVCRLLLEKKKKTKKKI